MTRRDGNSARRPVLARIAREPTLWFVEFLGDECFGWYSGAAQHHVVWCRAD